MAHMICFEAFPTAQNIDKMRKVLVGKHKFIQKENRHGIYFYAESPSMDAWMIKAILNTRGYKYRFFDKRYERSGNYRKDFFEENPGPHRCAYCGKRIRGDKIEVDHLIPVSKAKTSASVRTWLQICGIKNVNDTRNLVASCKKCNRKKSDKIGLWVMRGAIGRHQIFWTIRDIVVMVFAFLIILYIFTNYPIVDWIKSILSNF